jgi:hypothetical protein
MNISGASGGSNAGGGHVESLTHYFGEVDPQYQKMLSEDKFAHETYNLPKAYEGKNKYLESVIDYLITNDNDWYTSVVLPWVETSDLSVAWEIFRFNKTLMDLEPHQGVPRYVTAEREARTDRLVRRGLAFIIEHGFYTTDQGRQHYLMNLRQIVDSVNETAYHGVVYALLTSNNHYKEWERQHGTRVHRPGDLLRKQRRLWAVVQKKERGLYLLDAELKDTMRYEGVTPNTWIVPSKMSIYVTMVDGPTPLKYSEGGPATQGALEAGPSRFQTFRGSKVFESRPFDIDFIGEPYDLLVRRRQIGEHFVMGGLVSDVVGANDTYVYDMNRDNFERITMVEAAAAADGMAANLGVNLQAQMDRYIAYLALFSGEGEPASRVLLFRPWQTYDMASGILLKSGLETGMTAHGHHDFMLSDDVIHKVHIGHYTFYHKSIVKTPKNICIAEDIFARNYVRGEGTTLYETRQSFQDDQARPHFTKDMLAWKIPFRDKPVGGELNDVARGLIRDFGSSVPGRSGAVSNPLDITGLFNARLLDKVPTDLEDQSNKLYPGSNLFSRILSLRNLNTFGQEEDKFISPLRQVNTITFQGMQLDLNTGDNNRFTKITLNTGHWGPNVYAGCKSVRTGENAFLKDMEYEKLRTKNGAL